MLEDASLSSIINALPNLSGIIIIISMICFVADTVMLMTKGESYREERSKAASAMDWIRMLSLVQFQLLVILLSEKSDRFSFLGETFFSYLPAIQTILFLLIFVEIAIFAKKFTLPLLTSKLKSNLWVATAQTRMLCLMHMQLLSINLSNESGRYHVFSEVFGLNIYGYQIAIFLFVFSATDCFAFAIRFLADLKSNGKK